MKDRTREAIREMIKTIFDRAATPAEVAAVEQAVRAVIDDTSDAQPASTAAKKKKR